MPLHQSCEQRVHTLFVDVDVDDVLIIVDVPST